MISPDPKSVTIGRTIEELSAEHLLQDRSCSYPVVTLDGRPAGLLTLNQVKSVSRQERRSTRVGEIACPTEEVPVAGPGEPLSELLPRMAGCADGRALVMDEDGVGGIVSPSDVARRLEVAELRDGADRGSVHG